MEGKSKLERKARKRKEKKGKQIGHCHSNIYIYSRKKNTISLLTIPQ